MDRRSDKVTEIVGLLTSKSRGKPKPLECKGEVNIFGGHNTVIQADNQSEIGVGDGEAGAAGRPPKKNLAPRMSI